MLLCGLDRLPHSSSSAAGLVLGIALLVTFVLSIVAVVQRNHITFGFVVLNYALLIDGLMIVVIGTFVWYFTLQERVNFHKVYSEQSSANRLFIQEKVRFLPVVLSGLC